jgi:hypothetical protein
MLFNLIFYQLIYHLFFHFCLNSNNQFLQVFIENPTAILPNIPSKNVIQSSIFPNSLCHSPLHNWPWNWPICWGRLHLSEIEWINAGIAAIPGVKFIICCGKYGKLVNPGIYQATGPANLGNLGSEFLYRFESRFFDTEWSI